MIARIFRGSSYLRKIVVSAEQSKDLNNRPLRFYWAVLRGDPDKIRIEYLNSARSVAEITVPYHSRAPIAEGSRLESNRIDIGVFVHNGAYYSPPAFITFYSLDNEARAYGADGRVMEIAYGVGTSTISVSDWRAFFDLLALHSGSWPSTFLRKQFKTEEIAELEKVSEQFQKVHETLLAAQQELNAALKTRDKGATDLAALRKAVNDAQQSEKEVLQKKIHRLNAGAAELVQKVLNSLLQEPGFWSANANDLKLLYESTGNESKESFSQIQKALIQFGIAEDSSGSSFQLKPLKKIDSPTDHLTPFERGMIEHLNAIVLSRIVFPGIVNGEWRENYVDFRIASAKEWRDVYCYASDGTPVGWRRYQSNGVEEFNAEGLLILDKDPRGRCIRARVVRYELEPQKRDPSGRLIEPFLSKVKLAPTDTLREYEYASENDWKGHIKSQ